MAAAPYSVEGRTVLITGAARGIGAELARALSRQGARVSLVGLEPELLAEVARECGPQSMHVEADVTDARALQRAVEETVARLGGIDVVVANAGIGAAGFARWVDPAIFERTIEINLLGAWRTVRAALPHVIERQGYVLVVASVAAILQLPGMGAYSASKAGVEAFSNALRLEVRHLGVDVGVAYFSWIDTEMVRGAEDNPTFGKLRGRLGGPGSRTHPVTTAVDAVLKGIRGRSRWVFAPAWTRWLLLARGWLAPLAERRVAREIPALDRAMGEDVQLRGAAAASAPTGAGGVAAVGVAPTGSATGTREHPQGTADTVAH